MNVEFVEDVSEVGFDRLRAQDEGVGDLGVGASIDDEVGGVVPSR